MKVNQKILTSVFAAISAFSKKKINIVFEVTGIDYEGRDREETYMNGKLDKLPEIVSHLESLKSGTLWLTSENKDGFLGKRVLVCRKGITFRS